MGNMLLLPVCLLTGVILRHWHLVRPDSHLTVNQLLVTVFIPALTLLYVPDIHLTRQLWWPVLVPWLVFLAGLLFFWLLARLPGRVIDPPTLGALQLTGGISSISFVGFPVFELLYGKPGLAIGIVMSQAGTFLVVMTLGVVVASWHNTRQPSVRSLLGSMLRFPPFPVFLLALGANLAGYRHPVLVRGLLETISRPFPVLALLSVGLQLTFSVPAAQRYGLMVGLVYKLILAPLLVFGLLRIGLGRHDDVSDLCILGSAIGPMNTALILVSRYRLNAPLAAQMVGIGIPLSLPLLFLIHYFL